MTNRSILRIAMPLTLNRLRALLEALDGDVSLQDAIVRHHNGSLWIDVPDDVLALDEQR